MTSYTITDQITGTEHPGIDRYEIATTLKGLYLDAPAETYAVCDELEAKLHRGEYYPDYRQEWA